MHSLNALAFVYMTDVLFYILSSYKKVTVNFSIFLSQKTNNISITLSNFIAFFHFTFNKN